MNTIQADLRRPANLALLAVFLVAVIGVGALLGLLTAPGAWYASLDKPPFNPPSWLFAPVWFVLYVCIAIAGWRVAVVDPQGPALKIWGVQMILNWAWSPVFFSLHALWPAAVVIVAMLGAILAFMRAAWPVDRLATWLFAPYAAWVGFATLLNVSIAILN